MKTLFKVALSLILLLVCIGALSACFKHEHTYSDAWSSDDSYHWHDATCKHTTNISDKQEHSWDTGVLKSGNECGEGSVVLFTCTVCGKTVEKTNVDHNYLPGEKVAPDCTKFGYTTYECSRCSSSCVADLVEATGHSFGERVVTKEATCTVGGSQEESCSSCGKVNTYTINATGHNYVQISSEGGIAVFECEFCLETVSVSDGESVESNIGDEELFDVDTSFAFDIVTDKDVEYIKNNLKIVETYFIGTEYENNEALCQYTVVSKGGGVYTISPVSNYDYDTTYSVILSGDIDFADYKCERLNFTTDEDVNHENSYEYASGIIFLKELESTIGGYYPYSLSSTEDSEHLYLTVGKIDGISVGQIICIGEITSFAEIDLDTECYFGKVDSFYKLPEGKWMILLSEPEIYEIFAELDISYDELVDFDSEDVDVERIEDELVGALYQDEDFVKFLSSVNVAAVKYFNENGYDTSDVVSIKSFMEYVKVTPKVKAEGKKIYGDITGSVNIPIKDSHKNEIGKFELTFTLNLTTEFNVNASMKLKKKWGIPYGINYFDVSMTQTDTFTFDFKVAIEVDHSSEEQPFVQNTESGKIHRRGCVHLNSITDLSKLSGLSAVEMKEKIDEKPTLECKHCRPAQSFDDHILYVNTQPGHQVIHKKGCVHAQEPNGRNWVMSEESATYWMNQNYQCCEWCHPDNREEIEYEAFLSSTLYCADWQQIATDVTQWAKDSGMTEHARKGITIIKFDIPITFPLKLTVEVDFIFSFQLEASITYNYKYTQSNTYGMRVGSGGCTPYSSKSSSVVSNDLTMMGKVNVKVGLLVDVYINVTGLSKWMSAGITAEVGLYAELYGILHMSPSEFYAAAYLEAGVYVDIQAYYKLFKWNDNFKIYKDEFPILTMGYERAYYAYKEYQDKIEINGSYDIDLNDLLVVKYFNLRTMESATDELKVSERSKYEVKISFADGRYCEVRNGCIVAKAGAPASFTDTMTIEVECKVKWNENNWGSYSKDRYVFYLGSYEIELAFGDGVSHNPGPAKTENLVEPTCTKGGWYEIVVYCTDEGCGKEIKRETQTIDPLGHDYTSGICTRCGAMEGYSEGLDFTSSGNNTCYVSGLGSCTDVNVKIPPVSPNGQKVTSIGDFAIYDNSNIISISIPEGVESIGSFNFYSCRYLESVVLPQSLTSVGSFAFNECIGLKTVYYKGTGADWSSIMFLGISEQLEAATRYYYSATAPVVKGNFWHYIDNSPVAWPEYDESQSDRIFEFTLSQDGTYYVVTGTNDLSITSAIIPSTHEGLAVKEIEDYAFIDCVNLVSVAIPDSITHISSFAFFGCDSLSDISVDVANTSYKTIDGSLYSEDGSVLVQYARAKSDSVFTIPNHVTTIGDGALSSATSLVTINIHSGVTSIGTSALSDCASLREIIVDSSNANYKSVDGNLYSKDGKTLIQYAIGKSDTSFVIPGGVMIISEGAFMSALSLESITFMGGVSEVLEDAFYNCLNLKHLYYTGGQQQWNLIKINESGNEQIIYCEKTFYCVIT